MCVCVCVCVCIAGHLAASLASALWNYITPHAVVTTQIMFRHCQVSLKGRIGLVNNHSKAVKETKYRIKEIR